MLLRLSLVPKHHGMNTHLLSQIRAKHFINIRVIVVAVLLFLLLLFRTALIRLPALLRLRVTAFISTATARRVGSGRRLPLF